MSFSYSFHWPLTWPPFICTLHLASSGQPVMENVIWQKKDPGGNWNTICTQMSQSYRYTRGNLNMTQQALRIWSMDGPDKTKHILYGIERETGRLQNAELRLKISYSQTRQHLTGQKKNWSEISGFRFVVFFLLTFPESSLNWWTHSSSLPAKLSFLLWVHVAMTSTGRSSRVRQAPRYHTEHAVVCSSSNTTFQCLMAEHIFFGLLLGWYDQLIRDAASKQALGGRGSKGHSASRGY